MEKKDREKIEFLKKDYKNVCMNQEQMYRFNESVERGKKEKKIIKYSNFFRVAGAVAAAFLVISLLANTSKSISYAMENIPVLGNVFKAVTFREYHYEDDKHIADVNVSKLEVNSEGSEHREMETVADKVNADLDKYTEQYISQFKSDINKDGYQSLKISSEIVSESDQYFVFKFTAIQTEADSHEVSRFYTIDLNSGQQIELKDLFKDGSNYVDIINDSIKSQMREQMKADENIDYWLDSDELEDNDFQSITTETNFYVNAKNEVVICFDEGEVAPMHMGSVEFVIPSDLINDIRVN